MTTEYYLLKKPFTSIRVERSTAHDKLTLWVKHENIGTLTLTAGTAHEILMMFASTDCWVMMTHFGGSLVGCVVKERLRAGALDPDQILIDEYGGISTVAEVRRRAGINAEEMPK